MPTIGTPAVSTKDDNAVDISVTPAIRGGAAAQYRAVSTPGNIEATSYSSTITVPGLTGGTSYTFQVRAESATGATAGYTSQSQPITPEFNAMIAIATTPITNAVVFAFGNIPQNYQDLFIVINGTMNNSSNLVIDDVNNNAQTLYFSNTALVGNGSSAISERVSSNVNALGIHSLNSPLVAGVNSIVIHIANYANSTSFKPVLARKASDGNGSGSSSIVVGSIPTTSPLTYFKFSSQNLANYFTSGFATLYGIRASV
jgi:hypothetical protein